MEKGKESNNSNTLLIVIIVILVFVVGFLTGQLLNKKEELQENTNTEEKMNSKEEENKPNDETVTEEKTSIDESKEQPSKEEKEPPIDEPPVSPRNDDEEKEKPVEPSDKPVSNEENHHGCGVCSGEGEFCCGTSPDADTYNYDYITIDLKALDLEEDSFTTEEFEIFNDNYKYKVKYTKKNSIEKVIVNNRTIFERPYVVKKVFVLDNGMVGIEYYDDDDQARLVKRDYYSTNLNKIKSIEGISSNVDIFAKEFEYISLGDKCINDSYRELKRYKATINKTTIDTKLIRTEKEEGCAGMV